jgi:Rieske Fe-S protein
MKTDSSEEMKEAQFTRREFCNSLAVTSAGIMLATSSLTSEAATQQNPALVYPSQKIDGAERLMPSSSLYFTYPTSNDPALLVRAFDGQYYAYSQKCTHRGCSIFFNAAQRCLECPCHKGSYDVRSGGVTYGPPPRPLEQIVLQMRAGDQVWAVGKQTNNNNESWARAKR